MSDNLEMKTFDLNDLGSLDEDFIYRVDNLTAKMDDSVAVPLLSMESSTSDETIVALSVLYGAFLSTREDVGGWEVKLPAGYTLKAFIGNTGD